jgi:predicted AAA+ superfamily ATPase
LPYNYRQNLAKEAGMERLALKKLEEWKNSHNRKLLVLYDVRQVGKTWLMKEFEARHYKSVAYISFDSDPTLKNIFVKGLDIPHIIQELSIATDIKITSETLIIFDEVQECPLALTSLKYFNENAPEYQVIGR